MRSLIDNNLPPALAEQLSAFGHDAVHVRDYDLHRASDSVVFERAALEQRVLLSADTDFGTILALRNKSKPSFILFRECDARTAEALLRSLAACSKGLKSRRISSAAV